METVNTASRQYMLESYLDYQKRYADVPAERDKVMLRLLQEEVDRRGGPAAELSLLDIGCSNGNLLRFLRHAYPQFILRGSDVFPDMIEQVRNDSSLKGIDFEVMDVRDFKLNKKVDIVIANAVLFRFDDPTYITCCRNISNALRSGGVFFSLDFYTCYDQHLTLIERSVPHPEGLTLHFRPMVVTESLLKAEGFTDISFYPFDIPIDLPRSEEDGGIRTHTRRTTDGENLQFRGAIFQPWCHMVARKR